MVKVAPSLLSANFTCLKDDIEKIENGKADWLHYDVTVSYTHLRAHET